VPSFIEIPELSEISRHVKQLLTDRQQTTSRKLMLSPAGKLHFTRLWPFQQWPLTWSLQLQNGNKNTATFTHVLQKYILSVHGWGN